MSNETEFVRRFDALLNKMDINPQSDKAIRIFDHYLSRVQRGMCIGPAIDRCTHDLAGNNGHPTKPQRLTLSSEQAQ